MIHCTFLCHQNGRQADGCACGSFHLKLRRSALSLLSLCVCRCDRSPLSRLVSCHIAVLLVHSCCFPVLLLIGLIAPVAVRSSRCSRCGHNCTPYASSLRQRGDSWRAAHRTSHTVQAAAVTRDAALHDHSDSIRRTALRSVGDRSTVAERSDYSKADRFCAVGIRDATLSDERISSTQHAAHSYRTFMTANSLSSSQHCQCTSPQL
jgi:hypothetical protein